MRFHVLPADTSLPGHETIVGWNPRSESYFATVKEKASGKPVFKTAGREIPNFDELEQVLAGWAKLSTSIRDALIMDRRTGAAAPLKRAAAAE